jgi:hypothetical protein
MEQEMRIQPVIPRSPRTPFLTITNYTHPETGATLPLNNKTYFILSMIVYMMNKIIQNIPYRRNSKHYSINILISIQGQWVSRYLENRTYLEIAPKKIKNIEINNYKTAKNSAKQRKAGG